MLINQWFLGDTPTTTDGSDRTRIEAGDPGSWWQPAAVLLAAGCLVLAAYAVVRHWPGQAPDGGRPVLAWAVPWVVLPTAVIAAYSIAVKPVYSPRYLTFAAPAVALLVAAGLTALPRRALRYGVAALLVLAALPVYVSQRELHGKNSSDWETAAAFVGERARTGDGVYFAPRYQVDRPTVGQTARGVRIAYPDDFTGLVDVTELRTPVQADDLIGESRYLRQSGPQLATVNTLWVIRRVEHPRADSAADDAFLVSQGFRQTEVWRGPLDVVLRFERAGTS